MYWTLAIRHLLVRPGRAAVLLIGYGLGVAVMIVLLSVGDAMLDQSRDTPLIGGGQLTALPHGVDIEAMRTGGLTGMFFSINGAHFVSREMIGGARHATMVADVSPLLEQKLLEVRRGGTVWPVRAGGEIPSMTRAAGAAIRVLDGQWQDNLGDSTWRAPSPQALFDQLDRFHVPVAGDSSWAEWQYFNVVVSEHEWWYITMLVGGDLHSSHWGGEVLVTHRAADGQYQRFTAAAAAPSVILDTTSANLTVGASSVRQQGGVYRLHGGSGAATFDLVITPVVHQYFPPLELGDDRDASGYVVPALAALATGRLCIRRVCRDVTDAPAYHDHNWGSWGAVTWEWGAGRGAAHSLLYGGVLKDHRAAGAPFFLALTDSLGVEQIYRFSDVRRFGARDVPGRPGISAPDSLEIVAARATDTIRIAVRIEDATASTSQAAGPDRTFLQMRGRWRMRGTAAGMPVADSGTGFFETWLGSAGASRPGG